MKRIFTLLKNGKVTGMVHGPDLINQQVIVNKKVWLFDFDSYCGPLWLRRDGEPKKNQNPPKAVWKAFERWCKLKDF